MDVNKEWSLPRRLPVSDPMLRALFDATVELYGEEPVIAEMLPAGNCRPDSPQAPRRGRLTAASGLLWREPGTRGRQPRRRAANSGRRRSRSFRRRPGSAPDGAG